MAILTQQEAGDRQAVRRAFGEGVCILGTCVVRRTQEGVVVLPVTERGGLRLLRKCPGCGELFVDGTRNLSQRRCSPRCTNRINQQRWREKCGEVEQLTAERVRPPGIAKKLGLPLETVLKIQRRKRARGGQG